MGGKRISLGKLCGLFVLVVTFNVTGCKVVGPDFTPPPVPQINQSYKADISRSVRFDERIGQWWHFFNDPILNRLLDIGVQDNLDLHEAYHRIVEARHQLALVTGERRPNGGLFAEYRRTKRSTNSQPFVAQNGNAFDFWSLGLEATWEIDLFGRIQRTIEQANAEYCLQEADYRYMRMVMLADIAASYYRIRLYQQQLRLLRKSLENQSETKALVKSRTRAGLTTELDLQQTIAFIERLHADIPDLERQLLSEFNVLSILLGHSPHEALLSFLGDQPLPPLPSFEGVGVPADLLRRRPDVRRDELAVASASAAIGIAESDLYPRLSLNGEIGVSAKTISSLFETSGFNFQVGPELTWNIFHFGRICSNIEIQKARFEQAIVAYQKTVLAAVGEVEDAFTQQTGFDRRGRMLEAAIDADREAVELSLQRYKVGKANFQRVLDAQQQLLRDQQAQLDAQGQAIVEAIRIFKAAGGGWGPIENCLPGRYPATTPVSYPLEQVEPPVPAPDRRKPTEAERDDDAEKEKGEGTIEIHFDREAGNDQELEEFRPGPSSSRPGPEDLTPDESDTGDSGEAVEPQPVEKSGTTQENEPGKESAEAAAGMLDESTFRY